MSLNDRDLIAGPVDPGNPEQVDSAEDPVLYRNGTLLHAIRDGAPYTGYEDIEERFDLPGPARLFLAVNGQELGEGGHIVGGPRQQEGGTAASHPVHLPRLLMEEVAEEARQWGECPDVAACRLVTEALTRRYLGQKYGA